MANNQNTTKTGQQVPYTNQKVVRTDFLPFGIVDFLDGTQNYLRRLPLPTNDLERELGLDIYRRMMNDPQISASIYTAAHQVFNNDQGVMPAKPNPSDPAYKKSMEIADFIKRMIDNFGVADGVFSDNLYRSYQDVLEDALVRTFEVGNSATEMQFEVAKTGQLSGMAVLKSMAVREPHNYQYVTDKYNNVPYLAVRTGVSNDPRSANGTSTAPSSKRVDGGLPFGWELVNSSKFFIFNHRSKYGDPRGSSSLRPAYASWYMLQNIWPEYHKYLVQFGSPSIKGTTREGAVSVPNANGELVNPVDILYDSLSRFRDGSVLALEFGYDAEIIQPYGNGDAFRLAIEVLNHQIIKSILHSILSTDTSGNQGRAASSVHKDISDLPSLCVKRSLCQAQKAQIWKPLVALNFGIEAAQELTPTPTLGRFTPEDTAAIISSFAAAGYTLTPTQEQFVSGLLEIRLPEADETDAKMEALKNAGKPQGLAPGAHDAKNQPAKKVQQNTSNQTKTNK